MQRNSPDVGEDDVLGNLTTESVHAGDKHVSVVQLMHGLATVHGKLARLLVFVNDRSLAGERGGQRICHIFDRLIKAE